MTTFPQNFFRKFFSAFYFSLCGLAIMVMYMFFVPIRQLKDQNGYYFVICVGWCVHNIRFNAIFSRFKRLFCV